jgi:hypothetical protein
MASASYTVEAPAVLGGWKIGEKLGDGSWGSVYACTPIATGKGAPQGAFAVKVVATYATGKGGKVLSSAKGKKTNPAADLLNMESMLYTNILRWHPSLPVVPRGGAGDDGVSRWLVLQRLGCTLTSRLATTGGRTSVATAATVALQVLDVLAHIHAAGFLFVDVNGDNVMLGGPQPGSGSGLNAPPPPGVPVLSLLPAGTAAPMDGSGERAYLIDFGLAHKFTALSMGASGRVAKKAQEGGTPLFSSTAGARGADASPRDDMESLGYLLSYMLGGKEALPWHTAGSIEEAAAGKIACTGAALAASVAARSPPGGSLVKAYFAALDAIPHGMAKPNFDALRALLKPLCAPGGKLAFEAVKDGAGAPKGKAAVGQAAAGRKRKAPVAAEEPTAKKGGGGQKASQGEEAPVAKGRKRKAAAAIEAEDVAEVVKEEAGAGAGAGAGSPPRGSGRKGGKGSGSTPKSRGSTPLLQQLTRMGQAVLSASSRLFKIFPSDEVHEDE